MYIRDVFLLAVNNIKRAGHRSILMILAIGVSVASVLLISGIGASAEGAIAKEINTIGLGGVTVFETGIVGNGKSQLTVDDVISVKQNVKEVQIALPLISEFGEFNLKNIVGNMIIWGIDSRIDEILNMNLLFGRMPNNSDIKFARNVIVVDDELANRVYKRTNIVGKKISVKIGSSERTMDIIGVIKSQSSALNEITSNLIPNFAYLPYTTVNMLRNSNKISQIAIKPAGDGEIAGRRVVQLLSAKYKSAGHYAYENLNARVDDFKMVISLVALLISVIAGISLAVSGLDIMNAMLSSVGERKKEIGLAIAIGAKRSDIVKCFLTEAVIIAMIGGLLGAIVGTAIAMIGTAIMKIEFVFYYKMYVVVGLISIFCSVAFSILPAIKGAKLNPIVALKSE